MLIKHNTMDAKNWEGGGGDVSKVLFSFVKRTYVELFTKLSLLSQEFSSHFFLMRVKTFQEKGTSLY